MCGKYNGKNIYLRKSRNKLTYCQYEGYYKILLKNIKDILTNRNAYYS